MTNNKIELKNTKISDLEYFFHFQMDEEANYLAAFTAKDSSDKKVYIKKWSKLLLDETVNLKTIFLKNEIVGSIAKYEIGGIAEITYWIDKKFWKRGIATTTLSQFLLLETKRPINGRVAFDNNGSIKVLEKCGFKRIRRVKGFSNARNMEIEEFIYQLS